MARPDEHIVEHALGQRAGEGIPLARVIGAQQHSPVRRHRFRSVTKRRSRPEAEFAGHDLMGEPAERDDDPHVGEQREFAAQERKAGIAFGWRGLVGRGAQRTAATTKAPDKVRPSSMPTLSGWLAKPVRHRAANSQSPDRSPVNTRPVRLPPWAAGARPTSRTRAAGSPKPGTGRPQ